MVAKKTARMCVAEILLQIHVHGMTLPQAENAVNLYVHKEKAFIRALAYETLRYFESAQAVLATLVKKPLKSKDAILIYLLLAGIVECVKFNTAAYACVNEYVNTTVALKKVWAKGLVNGCLRQFLREAEALTAEYFPPSANGKYDCMPAWLSEKLSDAWPDAFDAIVTAQTTHPPLTLRVNTQHISRDGFVAALQAASLTVECPAYCETAVVIPADVAAGIDVEALPGYAQGWFSVQDIAPQFTPKVLALGPSLSLLDACAAPGGKTAHCLEVQPDLTCVAIDIDKKRLKRVTENLTRLALCSDTVTIKAADALHVSKSFGDAQFDRILLDAPCSGTGVIRRHPEIKLLRTPAMIEDLVQQQTALLAALWPHLKPGGSLVYATCSLLPEENESVVAAFVEKMADASVHPFELPIGVATSHGWQLLPDEHGSDGFFYARLQKAV